MNNPFSYTSNHRSASPMGDDENSARIRARLAAGGTAAQIAEEGYRVCRLNTALRRGLDDALKEIRSPISKNDDSAFIKNRLDGGATAKEIAEEAYRICRINANLRKSANSSQGELRFKTKSHAVKADALHEMRAEYPELRKVLQRTWGLLESRKIKIPEDLSQAYSALMTMDKHDWQPRKGMKTDARLTGNAKEGFQRLKKGKGKGTEKEKISFLLHTQDGRTSSMGKPMEDQDSDDDKEMDEDNDDDDNNDVQPMDTTVSYPAATNVVAGLKRKGRPEMGPQQKKIKLDSDESTSDFWRKEDSDLEDGEIRN
jgi:hypothetical protein